MIYEAFFRKRIINCELIVHLQVFESHQSQRHCLCLRAVVNTK